MTRRGLLGRSGVVAAAAATLPLVGGDSPAQAAPDDVAVRMRGERLGHPAEDGSCPPPHSSTADTPVNRLPLRGIDSTDRELRIGALEQMSEVAEHRAIRRDYPVRSQALELSASGQLRNMASIGGT